MYMRKTTELYESPRARKTGGPRPVLSVPMSVFVSHPDGKPHSPMRSRAWRSHVFFLAAALPMLRTGSAAASICFCAASLLTKKHSVLQNLCFAQGVQNRSEKVHERHERERTEKESGPAQWELYTFIGTYDKRKISLGTSKNCAQTIGR